MSGRGAARDFYATERLASLLHYEGPMDLAFMAGIVALSFSLALAGARVVLWSVFCLMAHPPVQNQLIPVQNQLIEE